MGLMDPCEKGVQDAAAGLTAQERANITLSAQVTIAHSSTLQHDWCYKFLLFELQHALRLIAFDKLHLVLGVDPLPPPGTYRKREAPPQPSTEDTADAGSEAKKARKEDQ